MLRGGGPRFCLCGGHRFRAHVRCGGLQFCLRGGRSAYAARGAQVRQHEGGPCGRRTPYLGHVIGSGARGGRLRLAERHGHRVIRLFHHGGVIFAVRLRQHVVGGALLRARGGPGRGIPPRLCPVRRRGGSLAPLGGVQRNVNIHAAALRAVRKRRGSRILSARVPFRPVGRRAAALLFAMSEQGGKQPFLLFSSAGQPSHLTFPISRSHPRKRKNPQYTTPAVSKTRGCGEQVAHPVCFFPASRTPRGCRFFGAFARLLCSGQGKSFSRGCGGQARGCAGQSRTLFFLPRVSHARGCRFFGVFARLLCSGQGKSFSRGCGGQDAPAPRLPCVHDTIIFFIIRPGRLVCQISAVNARAENGTKKVRPPAGERMNRSSKNGQ